MIWQPKPGQPVKLHYRKSMVGMMKQHHGKKGCVVRAGKGPGPINALIQVNDGCDMVVVPRGNLVSVE